MGRKKELIGLRFGRLLVVAELPERTKYRQIEWECVCDCGTSVRVISDSLLQGRTQSCGCLFISKIRKPKSWSGFRKLKYRYMSGAKQRGFAWKLTDDEFKQITSSDCFYCGQSPSLVCDSGNKECSQEGNKNSQYVYNGVDRLDTKGDYAASNVVPCCAVCNRVKWDHSVPFLYDHLVRMLNYATKTGWGGTSEPTTDTADDTARRQGRQYGRSDSAAIG